MKLHVVLTCPHALGVPGGGLVHCRNLAADLVRAGAAVTLVPVESWTMSMWPRPVPPPEMREGPEVARLREAGIDIVRLEQSRWGWWFDGLAVRRALHGILGQGPVHAVLGWWAEHAHSLRMLTVRGIFVGTLAAAPYSQWWGRDLPRLGWLHRRMDRKLVAETYRRSDRVFANSEFTADEVRRLLGVDADRIRIVHPPVSGRFAQDVAPAANEVRRLVYFGRLEREKGIFDLLDALALVAERPWTLTVAGSGQAEAVREAVERHGLSDRVALLGEVDGSRLTRELSTSHLAVLPSHGESFGLSLAEAHVAGLPAIAYDAGAVREVVAPGESGWLVPVGRVDLLAAAIAEAIDHPEETRRRATRARARGMELKDYSPAEAILRALEEWRARPGQRLPDGAGVESGAAGSSPGAWHE